MSRRVLVIGAHPDDADVKAGGTAALWAQSGFTVGFVSLTDGGAGHHQMPTEELVARRAAESHRAAAILGVTYQIFPWPDGHLEVTLERRLAVVRLIRQFAPDLVLTHRPNDYHPDHRYTAQLVQDAAYMIMVPKIAEDVAPPPRHPVFGYLSDRFSRPVPFRADVVVPIDAVVATVVAALDQHVSQMYEWLPYTWGMADQVPADLALRRQMLRQWYLEKVALAADDYRERLREDCDPKVAATAQWVEAFEISEYGPPLDGESRRALFPFLRLELPSQR